MEKLDKTFDMYLIDTGLKSVNGLNFLLCWSNTLVIFLNGSMRRQDDKVTFQVGNNTD